MFWFALHIAVRSCFHDQKQLLPYNLANKSIPVLKSL